MKECIAISLLAVFIIAAMRLYFNMRTDYSFHFAYIIIRDGGSPMSNLKNLKEFICMCSGRPNMGK